MDWSTVPESVAKRIQEVAGATEEPIEIYRERYTSPSPPHYIDKVDRYVKEIFWDIPQMFSLLVFGSGHPKLMNLLEYAIPTVTRMGCVDFVEEAGRGLGDPIDFFKSNILEEDLPDGYDYVFSSHVLEHFTRDQIINTVIPRMKKAAKEAVIIVVPYGDAWRDEPSHKCRFNEHDELAAMASKYKIILEGHELVLWIG